MMKKLSFLLVIISVICISCSKSGDLIDSTTSTKTSFSMTYDGITYTEAESNSLNMLGGTVAAKGTAGEGFLLTISGIGEDGSTRNICTDYDDCGELMCTIILDFGAVEGKEGLVATSGTVKRTGNKIEVSAAGLSLTTLQTKSLTATIEVGTIIGN